MKVLALGFSIIALGTLTACGGGSMGSMNPPPRPTAVSATVAVDNSTNGAFDLAMSTSFQPARSSPPRGDERPASRFSIHGAGAPTLSAFPLAVFCEDWSLPVSGFQQMRQLFAESNSVAPQLRVSSLGWGVWTSCLNFPVSVNNPQHVLRVNTDFPLLEINSRHDPATAYAWAVDDAHQLGRHARFVTYLGWGHGAYPHSACTIGTVDSYLISRTLPAVGTACPAVPPPDPMAAIASPSLPAPNPIGF